MALLINPHRGVGLPDLWDAEPVLPATDAGAVAALLARCPAAAETPLLDAPGLAAQAGVAHLHLKDETGRMGLGSFKALGAAYAIARQADAAGGDAAIALNGRCFIAASAGNHGLSVAVGARMFGARAVIVLAESVPESFADRLRGKGAEVVRAGAIYEDSMAEAMRLADANGWTLLSDSSWPGYTDLPFRVMEGYLQMAAEAGRQMPEPPSHIFLQAGVGGLAAAVAGYARRIWGDAPRIVVVEPEAAPALFESVRAGRVVTTKGPVSDMGRLDCKEPSLIALAGLARDADAFLAIGEAAAHEAVSQLAGIGISTTPSGAAGVAGLFAPGLGMSPDARVLAIISETGETA
ncbi:MAG: pyridoxal-phosphate dependent enzyme [Rhodobacter sp.]|nr:pyridoxal-phosphate dependent enzyme [Rhodobacter sp.]